MNCAHATTKCQTNKQHVVKFIIIFNAAPKLIWHTTKIHETLKCISMANLLPVYRHQQQNIRNNFYFFYFCKYFTYISLIFQQNSHYTINDYELYDVQI